MVGCFSYPASLAYTMRIPLSLLLLAPSLLALASCDTTGPGGSTEYLYGIGPANTGHVTSPDANPVDNISYWDGGGVSGRASIRINLAEQKAYFYKGGELVGIAMVSSGREGFNTPSGRFKIIEKDDDHRSNLFGELYDGNGNLITNDADMRKDKIPPGGKFVGAPMPHFMRIHRGVGMHAGYLPGYAASHGCIRMPARMAEIFFSNVSVGTPVIVE